MITVKFKLTSQDVFHGVSHNKVLIGNETVDGLVTVLWHSSLRHTGSLEFSH